MSAPILPLRPGAGPRPGAAHTGPAPEAPAAEVAAEAWSELSRIAQELHAPGALERGAELRHARRALQPAAQAVRSGAPVAAALAGIAPGESAGEHAAHTALAAMCVAGARGLPRAAIADVGVAALLHDAGWAWCGADTAAHTRAGAQRIVASTSWSPLAVSCVHAALAHHAGAQATLAAQMVAAADAYVTLLARDDGETPWASPAGSLARVLGQSRHRWHPVIPAALVRALGLHPPGQVVQLDDGSYARALAPDPHDPARPWIARLVDARGLPVPAWASVATPLPARRHVVRALPRHEWPEVEQERPAA